jgi:hypothetical protein
MAAPTTAIAISSRHGRRRSLENSHNTMARAPGKKYGTNPKWRPTRKYSTLCSNRFEKSWSTLSESESFVLIAVP